MNRVLLGALVVALVFPMAAAAAGETDRRDSPALVDIDYARGADEHGILVARVFPDTPAESAGILRGDVVLAMDGVEVNTIFELQDLLSDYEAGDAVELSLTRGGEEFDLQLNLETRLNRPAIGIEAAMTPWPESPSGHWRPNRPSVPGFSMSPDGFFGPAPDGGAPFMYRFFGDGELPEGLPSMGDVVTQVEEDGPADKAGILEGDIIVRIGDVTLDERTIGEAIADLAPETIVELEILRTLEDETTETLMLSVSLGTNDDGGAYLGVRYFPIGRRLREIRDRMERFPGGPGDSERPLPRAMSM